MSLIAVMGRFEFAAQHIEPPPGPHSRAWPKATPGRWCG